MKIHDSSIRRAIMSQASHSCHITFM